MGEKEASRYIAERHVSVTGVPPTLTQQASTKIIHLSHTKSSILSEIADIAGREFFIALATKLTEIDGIDYAFIAKEYLDRKGMFETIAFV
ncbi:MAG: hypothetical protein D6808_05240, partial [Candidatus Dadabacteria bacterium]